MNWHQRYAQQATWTRKLRAYLFEKAGLADSHGVLEVGCGTGAVLRELVTPASLHALDINSSSLKECRVHASRAILVEGNALSLPYSNEIFDIVYCHFLLLWVRDPSQALREMKRVTKPGGHILAFAEPDYSQRVDQPSELIPLGRWQTESLKRQGADPSFGARLAESFFEAGIKINETGTIQGVGKEPSLEEWEMEWAVIESDLAGVVPAADIQEMKRIDRQARASGRRILHVPTHFAWGRA
jgi:ubiquinone/menaquinone biosynthesis C-methylase UbiE